MQGFVLEGETKLSRVLVYGEGETDNSKEIKPQPAIYFFYYSIPIREHQCLYVSVMYARAHVPTCLCRFFLNLIV